MRTPFTISVLSLLAALSQPVLSQIATVSSADIELEQRSSSCSNPCGYYSQLCCTSSETCITNSLGEAECVEGDSTTSAASGSWQYYTTTYTQTDLQTITSTYSSYVTTAATATSTCAVSLGESVCGSSCCGVSESCVNSVCVAGVSSEEAATGTATGTATPAIRPTSSGTETVTATNSASTTEPFISPVSTNGTSVITKASTGGGLSGGAIAGIVIGTVAGVFLLILLCACLCIRGAIDGILAFFGLGGDRKRRETTYVEERVSHHSHAGDQPARRTWFGARPSRPAQTGGGANEKSSGFGWLGWAAIIAGALALCLGLRRRNREEEDKSEYSYGPGSSYYYYSDYYSGGR